MSGRFRRRRAHETPEMEITAFMNLMVILVPFLLVTAVFSRVAIIELGLPSNAAGADSGDKDRIRIEVTVRDDRIEVANRGGPALTIGRKGEDYNLKSLGEVLMQIKAEHPEATDATILLEPDISYEVLVQVMDTVRAAPSVQAAAVSWVELFPAISVGDAVPRRKGA